MEEESFLRQWFAENKGFLYESDWQPLPIVSRETAEHEVRFRQLDQRAVKRTWPGTFGNIPRHIDGQWVPRAARPGEYLVRQALQNEIFADDIRLEGAMESSGPAMIIGQPSGGLSLVISQPWLDADDPDRPHPSEFEISEFLAERGFEPIFRSLYGWRHFGTALIVLDAKPDNFIQTTVGILPIDLLLTQIFDLD